MANGPVSCIEPKPSKKTVYLNGVPISLMQLMRASDVDEGQISRILSGKRDPAEVSLGQHLRLAAALGMNLEDLLDAIYTRRDQREAQAEQDRYWHHYRRTQEERANTARVNAGLPPVPSLFDKTF